MLVLLLKSLPFWFKHQSLYILKNHCSILFFHAKYSNMCTAPGLFMVNHQCEPTTPLFSPISCAIRAASAALICGHENMVNNIIAALSCALMLREKREGPGGRLGCAEDVPMTFKNLSRHYFCFGRKYCLSLKHSCLFQPQPAHV